MAELDTTRVFDAPRERVYQAFTDPDQIARWFGPMGFSVPRDTVEIDVRPGGYQRFVMVSDTDPSQRSGVDAQFEEVVENTLLVEVENVADIPEMQPITALRLRLEFRDEDGGSRTRLALRQGPFPEEIADMAREGWGSAFRKLDTLLTG